MNSTEISELESTARWVRGRVVSMSHAAGTPHLGSSLSATDILVAAYSGILNLLPGHYRDMNRDRFILSKGHAVSALYATLAKFGFFPIEKLEAFCEEGGTLPEQPSPGCMPGVELATGSLGHGLSVGLGMAVAAKLQNLPYRVVALLSDGECNEGSVWEAAMLAPAQKIESLTLIVDFNKWQATGPSREIMSLEPLEKKFEAFGWEALRVDGHDIGALRNALAPRVPGSGKPLAIVADTIKGKGVSFMENDNNWHYRIPTAEEVQKAHRELGLQ